MVTTNLFRCLVFVLSCVTVVKAACDNQCSGHGTCGTDDVCTCYDNWGIGLSHDSGDCSDRICPYELAWVDKPNLSGTFHKYAECAGRGICSRDTGECVCFAGYEGMACQRMSCPNGCSGQGTCEYIEDLQYQSTWNEYTNNTGFDQTWMTYDYSRKFTYHQWDFMKSRACVCDAQYGDADCSKRMCPYGNDVLDNREFVLVSAKYQKQKIVFAAANSILDSTAGTAPSVLTMQGSLIADDHLTRTFALTFTSRLNETFTTMPIVMSTTDMVKLANDVKLALLKLPNGVIDGVTVVGADSIDGITNDATINAGDVVLYVTFTGPSVEGPQHLLQVEATTCTKAGCTPMITGLPLQTVVSATPSNKGHNGVWEKQDADFHSYECGRRGKCDYTTGLCACFTGYTGENCNTLTTLV